MSPKSKITTFIIGGTCLAAAVALIARPVVAKSPPAPAKGFDAEIARHAQAMMDDGRKIFRYDTLGSEAFWGDALGLHKYLKSL